MLPVEGVWTDDLPSTGSRAGSESCPGRSWGKDAGMAHAPVLGRYVNLSGEFVCGQRYVTTGITAGGRDGFPVGPGRYRLVVSRARPWASRAVIVRRLLGSEGVLSMGIAGAVHDAGSWAFDLDPGGHGRVLGIERL